MIVVSLVFLVTQSEFSHVNVLLSAGSSCYSKISARCLSHKKKNLHLPHSLLTCHVRATHRKRRVKGKALGRQACF